MAFEMKVDEQHRLVEVTFSGQLEVEDFVGSDELILALPMLSSGLRLLNIVRPGSDLSILTLGLFQERFIPIMEATADARRQIERIAWVIPSHLMAPIFRLWQSLPTPSQLQTMRVFRDEDEARRWLDGEDH